MLDYNLFKPIRNFGLTILATGVAGFFFLAAVLYEPGSYVGGKVVVLIISLFNFIMGYNITTRNRFGYKSLKLCLNLISFGFPPFGYFYAKKIFKHIETYDIEKFFTKSLKI